MSAMSTHHRHLRAVIYFSLFSSAYGKLLAQKHQMMNNCAGSQKMATVAVHQFSWLRAFTAPNRWPGSNDANIFMIRPRMI